MALDLYWQLGRENTWIGSLPIDTPLEELLFQFQQVAGIPVDPYGKSRLYLNQWARLLLLATEVGYPTFKLKHVQARIPPNEPEGFIRTVLKDKWGNYFFGKISLVGYA